MGTAKQLIPAFVDAEPLEFGDRSYAKNMRPIRGYPNYWRIIDTESVIDGPITQGGQYVNDLYLWQADILRDEAGALTDTIEVVNLGDYLTLTSEEEVNGETVYKYKYDSGIESFQYQHTDVIDSVSIEFDQAGRRLIAFESTGNIYFVYFDSQAGQVITSDFGAGYNPIVVTDTYSRTFGSGASERLLFYVDDATKQIVYRKQLDRFGVVYTLPNAPSDVVELLKVSKNIYGGLTVLYCYDDGGNGIGEGSLVTGSFTARSAPDGVNIGTDGSTASPAKFQPKDHKLLDFSLKVSLRGTTAVEQSSFTVTASSATIVNFELRDIEVVFTAEPQSAEFTVTPASATVLNFELQSIERSLAATEEAAFALTPASATVLSFVLKESLIDYTESDAATFDLVGTHTILNFTLG